MIATNQNPRERRYPREFVRAQGGAGQPGTRQLKDWLLCSSLE